MSKTVQSLKLCFALLAAALLPGCAAYADDSPKASFIWGPVNSSLEDMDGIARFSSKPAPTSRAAELREDDMFGTGFRSDAPNEKDWRVVRGTDKGPTIFGAALKFDLSEGGMALKMGAVRRGANRTYGPQVVFDFRD